MFERRLFCCSTARVGRRERSRLFFMARKFLENATFVEAVCATRWGGKWCLRPLEHVVCRCTFFAFVFVSVFVFVFFFAIKLRKATRQNPGA